MTDLETRVHTALRDRAGSAGDWRTGGATLREIAATRTIRRRRTTAVSAAALAVAAVVGGTLWAGGPRHQATPADPTPSPTRTQLAEPDPAWLTVPVTDGMLARAREAADLSVFWRPIASVRPDGSDDVVVLLGSEGPPSDTPADHVSVVPVTFDSDRPGSAAHAGLLGEYPSWDALQAHPAAITVRGMPEVVTGLVVLGAPDWSTITTAVVDPPDQPPYGSSVRSAVATVVPVELGGPEDIVRVAFSGSGDAVVTRAVPALPAPHRWADPEQVRVASELELNAAQVVQVRTDGQQVCQMTLGTATPGPPVLPWTPIDVACATIDGSLQLLTAEDRHYSRLAGVAPAGTSVVKLFWRVGKDTESLDVPVRTSAGVTVFVDTSKHSPDQLIRAEAWTRKGRILDEAALTAP